METERESKKDIMESAAAIYVTKIIQRTKGVAAMFRRYL